MRQSRFFKHLRRRGQTGQALVILAVGFIGLLSFVGIVTDVSLLFVRYSTLRRAVDAAAVAAAGQMRRIVDSNPNDNFAQDEADNVAQLNLAARQFIELYGLDPNDVWVETCRAQRVSRDADGNPLHSDGTPLLSKPSDDPELRRYKELCTDDELKLVRVTAQLNSPTIFLQVLGQRSVILTESAISQTAVIDVVLIFDVSESMMNETSYSDWERVRQEDDGVYSMTGNMINLIGLGRRSIPPVITSLPPEDQWGNAIWESTEGEIYARVASGARFYTPGTLSDAPPGEPPTPIIQELPRSECRWRTWPRSSGTIRRVPDWLKDEYVAALGSIAAVETHFGQPGGFANLRYNGFVPTFDYYGCCNDPNGDLDADGNFSFADLVCQPFRDARDAAELFLQRLDFKRGDRVAIVTFDRSATLIDPDGIDVDPSDPANIQTSMIEVERTLDVGAPGLGNHVSDRKGAIETLRDVVGVRAENTFYRDTNNDGKWDALVNGGGPITYAELNNTDLINITDYPVRGACPFDMAALPHAFTPYDTLPNGQMLTPNDPPYYLFTGYTDSSPTFPSIITVPTWYVGDNYSRIARSYEYLASCAGTNIGGGLARASSALYNNGRREGAVWIMVLLSDGAAGASDPVARNGTTVGVPANPFYRNLNGHVEPQAGRDPTGMSAIINADYPAPGLFGYGTFGVCPYGTASSPSELVDPVELSFPTCSDEQPQTRHFCRQNGTTQAVQPNTMALDAHPECITHYDVDDYARDWADWVGLANLSIYSQSGNTRTGQEQLPTIFSIGFGLNYPRGNCAETDAACKRANNIEDFLGEELLRYIADVGDNFRIDDDYWQAHPDMQDRLPSTSRVPAGTLQESNLWGPRGPCEMPFNGTNRGFYQPLTPETSCGNYFAAPDGEQLELVFNEIASRMFTRLSQ
jgi:hypothetical protein